MDIVFSTTDNAKTYWVNYRDGHQKAVSIGFMQLAGKHEDVGGTQVYVYTKIELIEVSCVAVGSNRGALVKREGMFDAEPASELAEKNMTLAAMLSVFHDDLNRLGSLFNQLKAAMAKDFNAVREDLEEIKTLITPDSDGLAEGLLLGSPPDPPTPAGPDKTAEQFDRIAKSFHTGD